MDGLKDSLGDHEYQCAHCKEIFVKAWTEEELYQKAEAMGVEGMPIACVCSECYDMLVSQYGTLH